MTKLLRIMMLLAITGALFGLSLPGLAALSGIDHRWPDVMAQFTAPAFILSLSFAVTLILLKKNMSAVGAVGVAALSLLAVWPQWTAPMGTPDPAARTVRLYSANVYYLNNDTDAIRRSIVAADADVVVLIELGREPAERIDEILAGYPNRIATLPARHNTGVARTVMASRLPMKQWVPGVQGIHALAGVVETPWGPLNIVATHLTRPWPFQFQWGQINQVAALEKIVKGLNGPVIVAGDFNAVSSARIGRQIQTDIGLTPAPAWPGTWPTAAPSALGVAIDQVWRSPDLAFVSRRLGEPNGSDHRPVVTEITRAAR
ncbi:MAG: endonuclease/exonuclease/phosphatase family protein [Pseudomonadota bacterium]